MWLRSINWKRNPFILIVEPLETLEIVKKYGEFVRKSGRATTAALVRNLLKNSEMTRENQTENAGFPTEFKSFM